MEKAGATGGDNLFSSHLTAGADSASRLLPNFLQATAERIIYMGQLQGLLLGIDSEFRKYAAVVRFQQTQTALRHRRLTDDVPVIVLGRPRTAVSVS